MKTLIRRRVLRRLIWVCTVCPCPKNGTLGLYWLNLLLKVKYGTKSPCILYLKLTKPCMTRFSGYKKQKTLQESFTATLYSGTSLHYDSQLMNITHDYSKEKIVISNHIHCMYCILFTLKDTIKACLIQFFTKASNILGTNSRESCKGPSDDWILCCGWKTWNTVKLLFNTENFAVITLKLEQSGPSKGCKQNGKQCRPHQTAPLGAFRSGSTLFAQTCQSKNLGTLLYTEDKFVLKYHN